MFVHVERWLYRASVHLKAFCLFCCAWMTQYKINNQSTITWQYFFILFCSLSYIEQHNYGSHHIFVGHVCIVSTVETWTTYCTFCHRAFTIIIITIILANVTNWLCNTLEGERLFGFIECNALPRLRKCIGNGFRFDLWMYRFNDFQSNCCIRLPYEMKSSKTITSNHLLNNIENFSYSNDYYCCCLMGSGNRKYIIGFCLYQIQ